MNTKELNSFKLSDAVTFHDKLNPKLWNGTKLRPEVRDQLIKIAEDFLQELGVHDLDVKDITISGSNAAFSYTKHSDLDLHILVDMGNLPVDEVYKELFLAKKTIYNESHDIKIHTIPVELYVQDSRQPVVSLGEYSVMNDEWKRIPTKRRSDFDQTATKIKYEKLLSLIEIALKSRKYSKVKHIIDTIKRYRQAGLDKGGEFGPENLAYKMLRSQGYITKLYDLRDKLHSEILTVETMYQNIDEEINPDVLDPRFSHTQQIGDYTYTAALEPDVYDPKQPVFVIKCYDDGKMIGRVEFYTTFGDSLVSALTNVHPDYQKQGIASTMYAYARMLGNTIEPSASQLPPGKKMWTAWKKSGDAQYLMKNIDEGFDQPYPITWEKGDHGDIDALARLPDGTNLSIMFNKQDNVKPDDKTWMIEFYRNNSQEVTGEGDAQKVFATVLTAIQQFITKYKPLKIYFSASKLLDPSINYGPDDVVPNPESRAKLYDRLVQRYAKAWGYRAFRGDTHASVMYELSRIPKQKAVGEDYTMQFAAEKTPIVSPYAGVKDNQYRGGISEAADMDFEEGDCPIFAIALHRLSKLPLMALVEYDEELGSTVLIHAYVKLDDRWRLDITGETDVDCMLQKYPNNGNAEEIEIGEKDLLELGYGKSKCPTLQQVLPHAKEVLQNINEASGYIPSEKQKNDPRFKTALTVDVRPDSIKKNAKAFYWNTSRAGIPPTAKANGKI